MIKFGNNDTKLYLGNNEIEKVYLGTSQVYEGGDTPTPPAPSYDTQYLTIESTSNNNTITLTAYNSENTRAISASTDNGSTWTEYTSTTGGTTIATLNTGGKVLLKGENANYNSQANFSSTNQFIAYGNIMSLVYGDNFSGQTTLTDISTFAGLFMGTSGLTSAENLILPATTLTTMCYQNMFNGCTSLTTAPSLPATALTDYCYAQMFNNCSSLTTAPALPATTLASNCYYGMFYGCTSLTAAPSILPATTLTNWCYYYMFRDCTSLTTAPQLSATTLADSCCRQMFQGCSSLTTAPELPATTLADSCYYGMFNGCTGLTTAPELPATTLTSGCYRNMFFSCTSLNYIKCLATDNSAFRCTYNWVAGVASSGTFVKAASMNDWETGIIGIPSGWTVQNDDGSPYIDDGGHDDEQIG